MLNEIRLRNFGPVRNLEWKNLGLINLIIGENGTGKTFILKAIYSAMRTLEEYKRGDDQRKVEEILAEKLYWTFQPNKIGDLVTKGADRALSCEVEYGHRPFSYSFGKDTTRQISPLEIQVQSRPGNSIFLPAKEVLSLHQIILESREQDQKFGFDDTYLDLARALRQAPGRSKHHDDVVKSRHSLEDILKGKVEYDDASGRWHFKKGNQKFTIGVTAEGIKKIAILDTLLGNRYLGANSIVFIDEPESSLHPLYISALLDIVSVLTEQNIQFFLASHSYFVLKKLFLIAQEKKLSIPLIVADSGHENGWTPANLRGGMPENAIINESIRLYKEEVDLSLK